MRQQEYPVPIILSQETLLGEYSNHNPLNFVERDGVCGAAIELGRSENKTGQL